MHPDEDPASQHDYGLFQQNLFHHYQEPYLNSNGTPPAWIKKVTEHLSSKFEKQKEYDDPGNPRDKLSKEKQAALRKAWTYNTTTTTATTGGSFHGVVNQQPQSGPWGHVHVWSDKGMCLVCNAMDVPAGAAAMTQAQEEVEQWLGTLAAPTDLTERIVHYNNLLNRCEEHEKSLGEQIQRMTMGEYAEMRERLMAQGTVVNDLRQSITRLLAQAIEAKREDEALQLCCVWCGKDCETMAKRDEHEEECGL